MSKGTQIIQIINELFSLYLIQISRNLQHLQFIFDVLKTEKNTKIKISFYVHRIQRPIGNEFNAEMNALK